MPCFSSFYSSSWWPYPSPPSPPTQPERQGNCLTITGMLMKTPTTSQWTLDTTFQMCHLQMGLFRSGPGHQVHFYNENNNVTMTTRASWYLWSILYIDKDVQTISLDATIRFQWNSTSLERHQGKRIHLFWWPGKAPSAAGEMRQLQRVEFFMKITNNERRRKNLS